MERTRFTLVQMGNLTCRLLQPRMHEREGCRQQPMRRHRRLSISRRTLNRTLADIETWSHRRQKHPR